MFLNVDVGQFRAILRFRPKLLHIHVQIYCNTNETKLTVKRAIAPNNNAQQLKSAKSASLPVSLLQSRNFKGDNTIKKTTIFKLKKTKQHILISFIYSCSKQFSYLGWHLRTPLQCRMNTKTKIILIPVQLN